MTNSAKTKTNSAKTKTNSAKTNEDCFSLTRKNHFLKLSNMSLITIKKLSPDSFEIPAHVTLNMNGPKERSFDGILKIKNATVGDQLKIQLNITRPTVGAVTSQLWYALQRSATEFKSHREILEIYDNSGKLVAKTNGTKELIYS